MNAGGGNGEKKIFRREKSTESKNKISTALDLRAPQFARRHTVDGEHRVGQQIVKQTRRQLALRGCEKKANTQINASTKN